MRFCKIYKFFINGEDSQLFCEYQGIMHLSKPSITNKPGNIGE